MTEDRKLKSAGKIQGVIPIRVLILSLLMISTSVFLWNVSATSLTDDQKHQEPKHSQTPITSDSLFRDSVPLTSIRGTAAEMNYTFYIIAGVFCEPQNVQKAFHSLSQKGYKPELLFFRANLSCKRVSVGKYKSLKKAEEALKIVRSYDIPDAWLLAQRY